MLPAILIYLIVLVPLAFLVRTLYFTAYRWLFTLFHGLWLTLLTLSCSNTHPLFIAEEAEALSIVTYLRELFPRQRADNFIKSIDNFLLVDVSMDTQLLTVPEERLSDHYGAVTSGVDRVRLSTFLNLFLKDSTIGSRTELIVCDLLLDHPSLNARFDSSLQNSLLGLEKKNELLMAANPIFLGKKTSIESVSLKQAPVDIDLDNGLFFSYNLIDSMGQTSLPYVLYQRLCKKRIISRPMPLFGRLIEEFDDNDSIEQHVSWGLNTFIPELRIADVPIQEYANSSNSTWLGEFLSFAGSAPLAEEITLQTEMPVYELGELLNKPEVLRRLLRLNQKQKKIVVIGSFKDSQRDVHQTAYGSMHGPLLLINVYLNLINGSHIVSMSYFVFLLIMFSLLSHQMLRKKIDYYTDSLQLMLLEWKRKLFGKPSSVVNSSTNKITVFFDSLPYTAILVIKIKQRIKHVGKLILEEAFLSKQPYWILLLILCISVLCFQHVINIMGLAIYIAAVDFSLKVLRQK